METRWGSTFMMVDRLIKLRPTIEEMADSGNQLFYMSPQQWEQAMN
jgi:hypothetical protein